VGMSHNIIRS